MARSPRNAPAVLQVFRLKAGRPPAEASRLRAGGRIGSGDELAFAYVNPGGHRYLMIYGLDRAGEIRWFHPAWTAPGSDPVAVPIRPSPVPVELQTAVSHRFAIGRLLVRALFLDRPLSVQQVETMLKAGDDGGQGSGARERWELELEVVDGDR
jgi:hypothetical protein